MKNNYLILLIIVFAFAKSNAQNVPQVFNWQGVITDATGNPLENTTIGLQFILHQDTADGAVVYTETHSPTTSGKGLLAIEVGTGVTTDDIALIDWDSGDYFLEIAIDNSGGTTYSSMGTTQLLSVPYALQSEKTFSAKQLEDETANSSVVFNQDSQNRERIEFKVGGHTSIALTENRLEFNDITGNILVGEYSGFNIDETVPNLENILIGKDVGTQISNQANNIGIGSRALLNAKSSLNIAIGTSALSSLDGGGENIAIGTGAGSYLRTASNNVMLGYFAGRGAGGLNSPENNVIIGDYAGSGNEGDGNVFIGYKAARTNYTGSNLLYIENTDSTSPLIYGEFDNDLIRINGDLEVTGDFKFADGTTQTTAAEDTQDLSLSGNTLSLTNGGSVDLDVIKDNLGNHTATENIVLNNQFISNDGGDEGLSVDNDGNVTASNIVTSPNIFTTQLKSSNTTGSTDNSIIVNAENWINFRTGDSGGKEAGSIFSQYGTSHYFVTNKSNNFRISHSSENNNHPSHEASETILELDSAGNLDVDGTVSGSHIDLSKNVFYNASSNIQYHDKNVAQTVMSVSNVYLEAGSVVKVEATLEHRMRNGSSVDHIDFYVAASSSGCSSQSTTRRRHQYMEDADDHVADTITSFVDIEPINCTGNWTFTLTGYAYADDTWESDNGTLIITVIERP